jgi:hypothetical protein
MLQVKQPEGIAGSAFWIKRGEFASAARSWRVRKLAGGIG